MFYIRPGNYSFVKIVGGELKNMFFDIKNDREKYFYSCCVVELVNLLTADFDKNPEKYNLIKRALDLLCKTKNPKRIYIAFSLRFLKLCGYKFIDTTNKNQECLRKIVSVSGDEIDDLDIPVDIEKMLITSIERYISDLLKIDKPLKTLQLSFLLSEGD